ncbi:MAG: DUF4861 family protein [Bacteroidales bacterium]
MVRSTLFRLFLFLFWILLTGSCSQKFQRVTLFLQNPADIEYPDAPVVIPRAAFQISDTSLLPIIVDKAGNYVPCQNDDLNGDGVWDHLAFTYDFDRLDSLSLYIEWLPREEFPRFEKRTNIRFAKQVAPKAPLKEFTMDYHTYDLTPLRTFNPYQLEGPSWENDKIGFRHRFDGSNIYSVMGKKSKTMVLDSVGILPNGEVGDTYHEMHDWGMELMDVSNQTGFGGISLLTSGKHLRLGAAEGFNTDNVDTTYYTLIAEGPVRSMLRLDYKGWDTGNGKMNLTQYITIWAGQRYYKSVLIPQELPDSVHLITGIPLKGKKNKSEEEQRNEALNLRRYETGYIAMMTHEIQSAGYPYYLGMALIIPQENYVRSFKPAPTHSKEFKEQWSAMLKPDRKGTVTYYVTGAWELEDEGFKSADYFVRFIGNEVIRFSHPIKWKITGEDLTVPIVFSHEFNEVF